MFGWLDNDGTVLNREEKDDSGEEEYDIGNANTEPEDAKQEPDSEDDTEEDATKQDTESQQLDIDTADTTNPHDEDAKQVSDVHGLSVVEPSQWQPIARQQRRLLIDDNAIPPTQLYTPSSDFFDCTPANPIAAADPIAALALHINVGQRPRRHSRIEEEDDEEDDEDEAAKDDNEEDHTDDRPVVRTMQQLPEAATTPPTATPSAPTASSDAAWYHVRSVRVAPSPSLRSVRPAASPDWRPLGVTSIARGQASTSTPKKAVDAISRDWDDDDDDVTLVGWSGVRGVEDWKAAKDAKEPPPITQKAVTKAQSRRAVEERKNAWDDDIWATPPPSPKKKRRRKQKRSRQSLETAVEDLRLTESSEDEKDERNDRGKEEKREREEVKEGARRVTRSTSSMSTMDAVVSDSDVLMRLNAHIVLDRTHCQWRMQYSYVATHWTFATGRFEELSQFCWKWTDEERERCADDGIATLGDLCDRHARVLLGVYVAPSREEGGGMGLFTSWKRQKGDVICEYKGNIQLQRPHNDGDMALRQLGRHVIVLPSPHPLPASADGAWVIDAARTTDGFARFCNDSSLGLPEMRHRCNCIFRAGDDCVPPQDATRVFLEANKNITEHTELSVYYGGKSYWTDRMRKSESAA